MSSDIVERLREPCSMSHFRNGGDMAQHLNGLRLEAASALEALAEEVERRDAEIQSLHKQLQEARDALAAQPKQAVRGQVRAMADRIIGLCDEMSQRNFTNKSYYIRQQAERILSALEDAK